MLLPGSVARVRVARVRVASVRALEYVSLRDVSLRDVSLRDVSLRGRVVEGRVANARVVRRPCAYHSPLFSIDAHGSSGARASPFCRSSIEMLSGERTKAMCPSRGGRLMVTPASISWRHLA